MSEVKLLTTKSDSTMSEPKVRRGMGSVRYSDADDLIADANHISTSDVYKKFYKNVADKPRNDAMVMIFIKNNMPQSTPLLNADIAIANCFLTPTISISGASIVNLFNLKNDEYGETALCAVKYLKSNFGISPSQLIDGMYNGGFTLDPSPNNETEFDTIDIILDKLNVRELDLTFTAVVFERGCMRVGTADLIWDKYGASNIKFALDTTIRAVANNLTLVKDPELDTNTALKFKEIVGNIYGTLDILRDQDFSKENGLTVPAILDEQIAEFVDFARYTNINLNIECDNVYLFYPCINVPVIKAISAEYLIAGPSYFRKLPLRDTDFKAIARANYCMLDYLQKSFGTTLANTKSKALDIFRTNYKGNVRSINDGIILSLNDYESIPVMNPGSAPYLNTMESYRYVMDSISFLRKQANYIDSIVDAKIKNTIDINTFMSNVIYATIQRKDINDFKTKLAAFVLQVDELRDYVLKGGVEKC